MRIVDFCEKTTGPRREYRTSSGSRHLALQATPWASVAPDDRQIGESPESENTRPDDAYTFF